MKEYRDTLAHRIPLYVPSYPMNLHDTWRPISKWMSASRKLYDARDWDELERVSDEQDGLGKPFPRSLKTSRHQKYTFTRN